MRDALALVAALALGAILGALPFLHYRLGGAHHGDHDLSSAHVHVDADQRKE
jgi:hypothetical protein